MFFRAVLSGRARPISLIATIGCAIGASPAQADEIAGPTDTQFAAIDFNLADSRTAFPDSGSARPDDAIALAGTGLASSDLVRTDAVSTGDGRIETIADLHLIPASLQDEPASSPGYGPSAARRKYPLDDRNRLSFGRQLGAIKWELGAALAWMTVTNTVKVSRDGGHSFRWKDEGWFGDNTVNLGMDKLAHAWNTYWLTDLIEARIRRKTGAQNAALPAAAVTMGLMFYSELWDAHKKTSGFSFQDIAMNAAGAGFSVLRNSVPGLDKKLDFRLQIMPNNDIYTFSGTRHYRQMRYLLALKLSGFKGLERSPLRFVELHAGYYATGFTLREEQRGEPRVQRPFFGIGLNVSELLFGRKPHGWAGRGAAEVLQYIQIPYTSFRVDTHGSTRQ